MPTTRPRHTITETENIAEAIDDARRRWPGERPGKLLTRLVDAGREALRGDLDAAAKQRERAVDATAGALSGVYPKGYLRRLRDEWPE